MTALFFQTTLFLPLLLLTACQQIVKSEMLEVDPFEGSAGKLDLKDSDLSTKYCVGKDLECPGENLGDSYYAPDIQQCMAKCSRNLECLSAFYKNKQCYLRKVRCTTNKLIDSTGGTDLFRLRKKEQCPENRPQWEKPDYNFSRRFCVYRGKACQGYNLYKKPLKIADLMACLQKCTRIMSCAGVDFSLNQCSPKDYQCQDDELTASDVTGNYMRLTNDQKECPENREEPVVVPEPTPKVDCPENSERKSETGTLEEQCECQEGFLMHEGTCFERGAAGGGLRPSDYKFCPEGSKRISETGTYADQCECEDGYSLVSETEDEAECVLIGTACQEHEMRKDTGECECTWGTKEDGSCQTTEPDCPPLAKMEMGQCKCAPPAEMHWDECFAPFECTVGETIQGKALYRTDEAIVAAGSGEECGRACSERADCMAASWLGGTQCLIHTQPLTRNLYDYGGRSLYCNSSPIPP